MGLSSSDSLRDDSLERESVGILIFGRLDRRGLVVRSVCSISSAADFGGGIQS